MWGRFHLGKYWGMPMVRKEYTRLITLGPYLLVRHPIYTGLCLAMIASMIPAGLLWTIWYLVWTLYFLYSAIEEEKAMLVQFPDEYPGYKEKTKMLIPFIL